MQTRNIILGPTEIKYNQNKHLQGEGKCLKKNRRKGKKCKQIISVNIILGPTEIKYSII
jgi:hypothetical protein